MTNDFPTWQQVEQLNLKKEYNATVWARDGEELTFHVKFGAGSHIGVNWTIEEVSPNAGSPSDIVADDCETQDPSSISHNPGTPPSPSKTMIRRHTWLCCSAPPRSLPVLPSNLLLDFVCFPLHVARNCLGARTVASPSRSSQYREENQNK